MIELLEHDLRPTLVLNLGEVKNVDDDHLPTYFYNPALASDAFLLRLLQGEVEECTNPSDATDYLDFRAWAISTPMPEDPANDAIPTHTYKNLLWSFTELKKRWRIINGIPMKNKLGIAAGKALQNGASISAGRAAHPQEKPLARDMDTKTGVNTDNGIVTMPRTWIDTLPKSEHVRFFLSTDWSATSLGPIESWSGLLAQMTRILMSDSRSAGIFWYEDLRLTRQSLS